MSSYSSDSSFLSTSPSSDGGFGPSAGNKLQTVLDNVPPAIQEEEPLDHPLLSSFNKDVVVTDANGFPVMQTKSAWEKQMQEKAKEDAKKAKKAARKAKHTKAPPAQTAVPLTKAQKKEKKMMAEMDD